MRLFAQHKRFPFRKLAVSVVVFLLIVAAFVFALDSAAKSAEAQSKQASEDAIYKAIAVCYATEGAYPESVEYLEEHYGVQINHLKYEVHYQTLGSNIQPYVQLVERGNG